jgi:hypothetical protein
MSCPITTFKYTGATPGADTTERDLFNSTDAFNSNFGHTVGALALASIQRLRVSLTASGNVTLKAYYSLDGGSNWTEVTGMSQTYTATAPYTFDFFVGPYAHKDVKITATNVAASAQTTYDVLITGHSDVAPAS